MFLWKMAAMGLVSISGNNYPAFGTVTTATTYLAARLGASWASQDATTQAQALVTALNMLDAYFQGLEIAYPGGASMQTAADANLLCAAYELAQHLLDYPELVTGINAFNARNVSITGSDIAFCVREKLKGRFPPLVQAFITAFLNANNLSLGITPPFVSGTDYQSVLSDQASIDNEPETFDLNRGLS